MRVFCISDPLAAGWWPSKVRAYFYALMAHERDARYGPELRTGISPDNVESDFRPIMNRFGVGDPPDVVLYGGPAEKAADRIWEPENQGKKNVALVSLDGRQPPDMVVDGLAQYDEVWVPGVPADVETDKGTEQLLRAAGLEAVWSAPVPVYEQLWRKTEGVVGARDARFSKVYCAVGHWREPDHLELVYDAYIGAKHEGRPLLMLVCPDAPLQARSIRPEAYVYGSLQYNEVFWRGMVVKADVMVDASDRPDFNPWLFEAGVYMKKVITPGVLEGKDVWFNSGEPTQNVLTIPPGHAALEVGQALHERLAAVVAGTPPPAPVEEEEPPKHPATVVRVQETVELPDSLDDPPLAVIIPHLNRGVEMLEPTLYFLKMQLEKGDHVIVVDQESDPDVYAAVRQLCIDNEVSLVTCPPPERADWSIGAVRNAGATAAPESCELLFFLDADVMMGGYIDKLRLHAARAGVPAVVPMIVDLGPDDPLPIDFKGLAALNGDDFRQGSGCAMVRRDLFEAVGGYDEAYQGWGSEDVDLLQRLTAATDGLKTFVCTDAFGYHQHHAEAEEKAVFGPGNRARCMMRMGGEDLGPLNPDGRTVGKLVIDCGKIVVGEVATVDKKPDAEAIDPPHPPDPPQEEGAEPEADDG